MKTQYARGPYQTIRSTMKPGFRRVRRICCTYESIKCLDVQIWQFLCWQTDRRMDRRTKPIFFFQGAHKLSRWSGNHHIVKKQNTQCLVKGRQRTPRARKKYYGQTLHKYGFLYKHMGKLQSAVTLILRCESKFRFIQICRCDPFCVLM
jgi:hypothetical protein